MSCQAQGRAGSTSQWSSREPLHVENGRARLRRAVTFPQEIEFRLDLVSPYRFQRPPRDGVSPEFGILFKIMSRQFMVCPPLILFHQIHIQLSGLDPFTFTRLRASKENIPLVISDPFHRFYLTAKCNDVRSPVFSAPAFISSAVK